MQNEAANRQTVQPAETGTPIDDIAVLDVQRRNLIDKHDLAPALQPPL